MQSNWPPEDKPVQLLDQFRPAAIVTSKKDWADAFAGAKTRHDRRTQYLPAAVSRSLPPGRPAGGQCAHQSHLRAPDRSDARHAQGLLAAEALGGDRRCAAKCGAASMPG